MTDSPQQMTEEQRQELEKKLKSMSPEELAEFQKQQCIFCQIMSGKVPSKKVFEDDQCFAILDINPATKGHILVIPKEHYAIMPQIPDDKIGHLFNISRQLSQVMLRALKVSGTNLFVANGLAAGQRSQHFMIHVIPRLEGDKLLDLDEKIIPSDEQQKVKQLIQNKLFELLDVKKEVREVGSDSKEVKQSSGNAEDEDPEIEMDTEITLKLKDVPKKILNLVKKKLPKINITEIQLEERDGRKVYEFDGMVDDKAYEIEVEVDEKGNVINVEIERESDDKSAGESDRKGNPDVGNSNVGNSKEGESKDESKDKKRNQYNDQHKNVEQEASLDDIANLFK
jgi:histidine triad (HIT) family protein